MSTTEPSFSVQPARPGSGDPRYSGLSGVWFTDLKHGSGLKVFFAVTIRSEMTSDGTNTRDAARAVMQGYIDDHLDGLWEIDSLCFWTDKPSEVDQRPAQEQKQPPPQNRNSNDSRSRQYELYGEDYKGKAVKCFKVAHVQKAYNNNANCEELQVFEFFGKNPGKFPSIFVRLDTERTVYEIEQQTHKKWGEAKIGQAWQPENYLCLFTESTKTKQNGQPYLDFLRFEAEQTNEQPF